MSSSSILRPHLLAITQQQHVQPDPFPPLPLPILLLIRLLDEMYSDVSLSPSPDSEERARMDSLISAAGTVVSSGLSMASGYDGRHVQNCLQPQFPVQLCVSSVCVSSCASGNTMTETCMGTPRPFIPISGFGG